MSKVQNRVVRLDQGTIVLHHSFIFHPTMLHLPYLLQHVPRIWNLFHIVELGNPIGWRYDGYSNVNGKCRKPHPTSRPLDAKRSLHAGCTKCSPVLTPTFSPSFPSSSFTTTTTSITPVSICIGPGPINTYTLIISSQGTKDCQPPPLFWKKRWHGIFYQQMLSIYEQPKIRIPQWGCQDLLDPIIHADWFC